MRFVVALMSAIIFWFFWIGWTEILFGRKTSIQNTTTIKAGEGNQYCKCSKTSG
jgi:hypothetical protein